MVRLQEGDLKSDNVHAYIKRGKKKRDEETATVNIMGC
jgi:hypothetical protein